LNDVDRKGGAIAELALTGRWAELVAELEQIVSSDDARAIKYAFELVRYPLELEHPAWSYPPLELTLIRGARQVVDACAGRTHSRVAELALGRASAELQAAELELAKLEGHGARRGI
jgi:hypothetical protein